MATNDAYRDLHRESTLAYRTRVLSDPQRREAIRLREAELQRSSPERKAKKAKADKARFSRVEVRQRTREIQKRAYHEKQKNNPDYKLACKLRGVAWVKKNRAHVNAKTASRRAARVEAQPPSLYPSDIEEIRAIYNTAKEMSSATGVPHEVDHIVPLKHPLVCGLHVPWNLQVLTEFENRAKGNKFEVD